MANGFSTWRITPGQHKISTLPGGGQRHEFTGIESTAWRPLPSGGQQHGVGGTRPTTWRPLPGPVKIGTTSTGRRRYDFPGVEVTAWQNRKINPPSRPIVPRAWKPPPTSQRMLDIARDIQERRTRDLAEARARDRAAKERRRASEQNVAQAHARQRASQDALSRQLAQTREYQSARMARLRQEQAEARQQTYARQRRAFERQREQRASQRAGTWMGTMLGGMAPPAVRRYATRRPLETHMHGKQGAPLLFAEAGRVAQQAQLAMDDFNFWVVQATSIVTSALGAAGQAGALAGAARGLTAAQRPIQQALLREIGKSSAKLAKGAVAPSTDKVLMQCRDEAFSIVKTLFRQDVAGKTTERPQRYGEIIDAVFKALVQNAKRTGALPQTIKTAPPPLSITGTRLPIGGAVDVWDSATGVGWDVTKATVRDVAGHDVRYLLGRTISRGPRKGTVVPPRNVMPDGTRLRDVRPLVYPRTMK